MPSRRSLDAVVEQAYEGCGLADVAVSGGMAGTLLLTGAPGTGKSSTLDALSTLLEIEGIEFGAIEAEQLAWGHPPLAYGAAVQQLAQVLAFQRRMGRNLFLVVSTTENFDEMAAIVAAMDAHPLLVVCLAARPETLAARLEAREPDRWPGKRDLIARACTLAGVVPRVAGIDLVIDTDAAGIEEVAAQIYTAMQLNGLSSTMSA